MRYPRSLFERLAEKALSKLPGPFRELLHNLEISVRALLGLYQGLNR